MEKTCWPGFLYAKGDPSKGLAWRYPRKRHGGYLNRGSFCHRQRR
nr:hypothetical protein [Haliscomenobacter sp.]